MPRAAFKKVMVLTGCLALALTFMAGPSWSKEPHPAQKAALNWLGLIDAGDFGESWNQAGGFLQKQVKKQEWVKTLEVVRKPLGKVLSRILDRLEKREELPGVPDGQYVLLMFKTSLSNKKNTMEQLALRYKPKQGWKVVGYFIL
jgi:hypothetical protein